MPANSDGSFLERDKALEGRFDYQISADDLEAVCEKRLQHDKLMMQEAIRESLDQTYGTLMKAFDKAGVLDNEEDVSQALTVIQEAMDELDGEPIVDDIFLEKIKYQGNAPKE